VYTIFLIILFQVFQHITKLVLKTKKDQQAKVDEAKQPAGMKLDNKQKKKKGGCCK